MKYIKILLCSLPLILFGCSKPDNSMEDMSFRDGSYITVDINGITNPYHIDESIYLYTGYDKQGFDLDDSISNTCSFRVYKIKEDFNIDSKDSLLNYIRQFDDRELREHPNRIFKINDQSVETIWLDKDNDVDIFNLLGMNLTEFYGQETLVNPVQSKFNECVSFLADDRQGQDKAFIKKYNFYFFEKAKGVNKNKIRREALSVINDPDTLIRSKFSCSKHIIDFYNIKNKLIISFYFSLNRNKPYPNPNCSGYVKH